MVKQDVQTVAHPVRDSKVLTEKSFVGIVTIKSGEYIPKDKTIQFKKQRGNRLLFALFPILFRNTRPCTLYCNGYFKSSDTLHIGMNRDCQSHRIPKLHTLVCFVIVFCCRSGYIKIKESAFEFLAPFLKLITE